MFDNNTVRTCGLRLVLFGPGIESEHTKLLVHKIVSARSSTFDAVEFIKGLPGGKIFYKDLNSQIINSF